ncbi:MAG: endonuclease/exonuclease/phosphatase family protein [Egibacteraceae bacterium]
MRRALRIATYNLLHGLDFRTGMVDLDGACAVIAGLEADVVAVQEVDRGLERTGGVDQVARLAELLGWHGAFAPALLGDPDTRWSACPPEDAAVPAYGVGLLSRLPLADVQRRALPGGGDGQRKLRASPQKPGWDHEPRVALSASVAADGGLVRVTTTHLSYLPWRCVAQLRAAARFAQARRGHGAAALLGDLNLPAWGARLALSGTRWAHAGGAPTYPAWEPKIQTDQLLVTGGLLVRELTVGPPATSDHLPLLATLVLT